MAAVYNKLIEALIVVLVGVALVPFRSVKSHGSINSVHLRSRSECISNTGIHPCTDTVALYDRHPRHDSQAPVLIMEQPW